MKKIFSLILLCSIFMGCTSAKLISSTTIPSEKETVYISFDNTQATVSTGGFVVGNTFFAGTDTASFNTLENRMLTDQLVIHHIGGDCDRDVSAEEVHQWHINRGWSGIGYHFLIRKDGTIERGRPIDTVGAHVEGQNSHTIGINISGNFCNSLPTDAQIVSAAGLAADLCSMYRIRPSYNTIVGHCDLASTACPGNYLYERIPDICQMAADLV